jgi:hypothetical protein
MSTRGAAGYSFYTPPGTTLKWGGSNEKPWLDTSLAIGLRYKHELVAIAGLCQTLAGRCSVTQLQGVPNQPERIISKPPRKPYETGLHGGFLWRHTLANGAIAVAKAMDFPTIEIQGSTNNMWLNGQAEIPERNYETHKMQVQQLYLGYDQVAADLNFIKQPDDNWALPLV